jgi:hypothetical protein
MRNPIFSGAYLCKSMTKFMCCRLEELHFCKWWKTWASQQCFRDPFICYIMKENDKYSDWMHHKSTAEIFLLIVKVQFPLNRDMSTSSWIHEGFLRHEMRIRIVMFRFCWLIWNKNENKMICRLIESLCFSLTCVSIENHMKCEYESWCLSFAECEWEWEFLTSFKK